jgi:hypothetical protein
LELIAPLLALRVSVTAKGEEMNATVVRLNARIANQRDEIKHKQFVLKEVVARTSRLLDMLGIDPAQPIMERLAIAIEAQRAVTP